MNKYLKVFKVSFQQEFAYRVNFIMWRVRNVLQIFLVFFLWDTVFASPGRQIFGYGREEILTYVFGLLVVRAFVLSAKANEVGGEIARGDLNNYLLKPVNYFRYWLTRDVASKALNLSFAFVETAFLYIILKPSFFIQTNPLFLIGFLASAALAMLIYFMITLITGFVPFWSPVSTWGATFIVNAIFIEFLSGALFPLDILPGAIQNILNYTPFPYMIFFPLQIYLGKVAGAEIMRAVLISGIWVFVLWFIMNSIWRRGLKVYQAFGR